MPPNNATEEIIEKKSGSPVATSCLIIAMVALLASMLLQILEIGEYRRLPLVVAANQPNPAQAKASADTGSFHKSVSEILDKKAAGGDAAVEAEKPDEEKAAGKPDGDADAKDTDVKDTDVKDTDAKDTGAKDTGAKDTGAKDTGAKDTDAKDTDAKDTNAKDTNAKDTNAKDTGTKDSAEPAPEPPK